MQTKPFRSAGFATQVPPLRHGSAEHASSFLSHKSPEHDARHLLIHEQDILYHDKGMSNGCTTETRSAMAQKAAVSQSLTMCVVQTGHAAARVDAARP